MSKLKNNWLVIRAKKAATTEIGKTLTSTSNYTAENMPISSDLVTESN